MTSFFKALLICANVISIIYLVLLLISEFVIRVKGEEKCEDEIRDMYCLPKGTFINVFLSILAVCIILFTFGNIGEIWN